MVGGRGRGGDYWLVGELEETISGGVHALDVLLNALDDDGLELALLGLHADVQVKLLHQVTNQGCDVRGEEGTRGKGRNGKRRGQRNINYSIIRGRGGGKRERRREKREGRERMEKREGRREEREEGEEGGEEGRERREKREGRREKREGRGGREREEGGNLHELRTISSDSWTSNMRTTGKQPCGK